MGTCCCWLPSARTGQARSFLLESFLLLLLFSLSLSFSLVQARTQTHVHVSVQVHVSMCVCVCKGVHCTYVLLCVQTRGIWYHQVSSSVTHLFYWNRFSYVMARSAGQQRHNCLPRTVITDMWYCSKSFRFCCMVPVFLCGKNFAPWAISSAFPFCPTSPVNPKAPKSTHWSHWGNTVSDELANSVVSILGKQNFPVELCYQHSLVLCVRRVHYVGFLFSCE